MPVGTLVLPLPSQVVNGVGYGADGTEFTGTYTGGPPPRPRPSTVTLANQGVTLFDLLDAFARFVGITMDFQVSESGHYRDVVVWDHPSRVQEAGRQRMVWVKLADEPISPSPGPGRWGDTVDVKLQVGLVTRGMADGSQRDIRKAVYHYLYRLRLENAIQGKMLFYRYQGQPVDPPVWTPPAPMEGEIPLTRAVMTIEAAPGPAKTQVEEGTNETTFIVKVPCVLLLTLPTTDNP